ncbi:hypothetical protein TSMEX_003681 [Taenia solium]|eukprot:TsM_000876400 transcript=TsM_000876400 gene=TsM_000876400
MDVSEVFDSEIGNKSFKDFSTLQELLSEFSRKHGVKYKVSNSLRYNDGDPRKRTLVYTMALFSCVLKRAYQCPSSFRIEVRKGALQIVNRMMQHNHGKIAGDPEPVVDLTEQFNAHFLNAKLTSFAIVMAKVKAFEEATGSEFRVGRSDLFKAGDKEKEVYRYRRITYECIHYGQRKSMARCASGTAAPGTSTARLGCMAKFDVRYAPEGFKISAVVMKHNHEVSPTATAAAGRFCRRKMSQYHQRRHLEGGAGQVYENVEPNKDTELDKDQTSNGHCDGPSFKPSPSTGIFNECSQKQQSEGEDEKSSAPTKAPDDYSLPPPPSPAPPCLSWRVEVTKTPVAPQPYWIANPATLLTNSLPLEHSKKPSQVGLNAGSDTHPQELSQSERRLLLSGKMQRVLDKACHGDAKRFRECNSILDDLERCWAKEDSMV